MKHTAFLIILTLFFSSCGSYYKNDFHDNSPTSGKLKVYYEEGIEAHVTNQIETYLSQYPKAEIYSYACSDDEAVAAMYNDSCKAIIISRELNEKEKKLFSSKNASPAFSKLAYSGIALICNKNTKLKKLETDEFIQLLSEDDFFVKDSLGNKKKLSMLIAGANSSVMHYLQDSLLKNKKPGTNCHALSKTKEVIDYVCEHENCIGVIDFAALSDIDDEYYKNCMKKINFVALPNGKGQYSLPCQSSFKTGDYPLTRTIYYYRNTGEFSLAKGLESFIAGPKGQLTFLKQGLLPYRQQERNIEVVMEPMNLQ